MSVETLIAIYLAAGSILVTAISTMVGIGIPEIRCLFKLSDTECANYGMVKFFLICITVLIVLSFLLSVLWLACKWVYKRIDKPKNEISKYQYQASILPLGENPRPIEICEYLHDLVAKNKSIIQHSDRRESTVNKIVEDLKSGLLRIYFFGHQNAGKSSLINSLLGKAVSPTFPLKMTTCLVRIRWGAKASVTEVYENGERKGKISILKKRMKEWSDLSIENRPREVIIEIPHQFLKAQKIELIDSPGTGSAWHENFGSSLEDEIVDSSLKSAAIVVIVYKYNYEGSAAHEKLISDIGDRKIPAIAVCNLGSEWFTGFKTKQRDTQTAIHTAERTLRNKANARCYRIVAEYETKNHNEIVKISDLASQQGAETVEDLRASLIELLEDRQKHIVRQAVLESRKLIDELLRNTNHQISNYQPLFNQIEAEQKKISEAISEVRKILNKGYKPEDGAETIWSSAAIAGTATTVISAIVTVGASIPFSLALGAIGAAGGGTFGAFINSAEVKKRQQNFEKQLADEWTNLQRKVTNSRQIINRKIIAEAVIKDIRLSSSSLTESHHRLILNNLEEELSTGLQKIEGYRIYKKNLKLDEQLRLLKDYLHRASV